jgi:MFS family permease
MFFVRNRGNMMKTSSGLFLLFIAIPATRAFTCIKPTNILRRSKNHNCSLVRRFQTSPSTKEELKSKSQPKNQRTLVNGSSIETPLGIAIGGEETFYGVPRETAKSLSILLASQFILFVGVGAVIPSIPLYGKEIGFSSAVNGLVISTPALALLLLAKKAGQFADLRRKPAMMWGMLIIALSDLGTALAGSIVPLIIARLGLGAGRCISENGERGMIADLVATIPELRGRVLSLQQAVTALGIAIGAPLGGIVVEKYGPRAAFLCVTAAALIALVMYSFLPETLDNESNVNVDSVDGGGIENETMSWNELLKDSRWRGLSTFEIGARFGYAAKLASIPVIATAVLPGGAIGSGALLSAAGLSGLVGAPLGGILTDRLGAKKMYFIDGFVKWISIDFYPFCVANSGPRRFSRRCRFLFSSSTMEYVCGSSESCV